MVVSLIRLLMLMRASSIIAVGVPMIRKIAKSITILARQAEECGANDVAHLLEVAHLLALEAAWRKRTMKGKSIRRRKINIKKELYVAYSAK